MRNHPYRRRADLHIVRRDWPLDAVMWVGRMIWKYERHVGVLIFVAAFLLQWWAP